MTPTSLQDQLVKYLTDVHAIEQQALAQMRDAPKLASEPAIAAAFSKHLTETEEQERLVRARLEQLGADPATVKDLAGALTGKGFVAFAAAQPDTPGKLLAHAYAYEHMEQAAYELLGLLAGRIDDEATVTLAASIAEQEREMGRRLEELFATAVEASLRALDPHDLEDQLDQYLADVHAIEEQSIQLLQKSPKLAGDGELARAYEEHLAESEAHRRVIEARLEQRDAKPSKLKDAVLRLGALNWGAFFAAQPDTPAKLAAFAYAFEHLEIGGYELLSRTAQRARDRETVELAQRILGEERAAAQRLRSLFDAALEASLREQDLAVR